jgi:GNAT superfamily N-acetyltransferase
MITMEHYKGYRIVCDSEAQSGPEVFLRIGPLAFDREIRRELGGAIEHYPDSIWVLVFDAVEQIAACATLHQHRLAQHGEVWLDNAYVRSPHRGKGLHGRLFDWRMSIARDLRARVIRGIALPAARLIFESQGFTVVRERGKYRTYEKKVVDA